MTLLERESQLGSLLQYADEARDRSGSPRPGLRRGRRRQVLARRGAPAPPARRHLGLGRLRRPVHAAAARAAPRHRPRDRRQPAGDGAAAPPRATRSSTPCCSARRPSTGWPCWWSRTCSGRTTPPSTCSASWLGGCAKLPVLLLVTFRDDALAPTDPLRVALGELAGPALHAPHRPPAADRRRRTPPRRGLVVLPRRAVRAHRRQPVLRGRGAQRAGHRDPGVGPRRRARPRCPTLASRARTTLDLASLDSWRVDPGLVGPRRRARARDVRRAGRGRAAAGRGRRRCGSGTSSRAVPSSPRCRRIGGSPGTRRCSRR